MPLTRCGSVSARLSVWFSRVNASWNCSSVASSGSMPPGSSARERRLAAHHLHRRAFPRAGLGEEERAVRELERREEHLRAHAGLLPRLAPPQAAGDHQVDDQEQVVGEHQHDALADAAHVADGLAVERVDRRIDGPENEGAEEVDSLEAPAGDVAGQRLDVDNDVWQFRQSLPQPLDNLLARPLMVVVQVQDDRVERQPLVAADGTPPPHVLEAVEQAIEPRTNRARFCGSAYAPS